MKKKRLLMIRMDLGFASLIEQITIGFCGRNGTVVSTCLESRPNLRVSPVALSALGASRDHSASSTATCILTHAQNTRPRAPSCLQRLKFPPLSSYGAAFFLSSALAAERSGWGLGGVFL